MRKNYINSDIQNLKNNKFPKTIILKFGNSNQNIKISAIKFVKWFNVLEKSF